MSVSNATSALRRWTLIVAVCAACALAACDDQRTSDGAKTPPPTPTFTPAPGDAVIIPSVEGGSGPASGQVSPLATPDVASPLPTPTPAP